MNTLRKLISVRIYIVSFFEALLAIACYTAAVFIERPVDADIYLEYEGGAVLIGFLALTVLLLTYIFDFYKETHIPSQVTLVLELGQLFGAIFLIQAVCAFVDPRLAVPQTVLLLGSVLLLIVLVPWRLVVRPAIWDAFGAQQTVFVGHGPVVADLLEVFTTQAQRGVNVAGVFVEPGTSVPGMPVLGSIDDFSTAIADTLPDRIIVDPEVRHPGFLRKLLELSAAGVPVETASQAYESVFARVDCRQLDPYVVLFLEHLKGRPGAVALQSIYTNLLGLMLTVLSLPLILLLWLLLAVGRKGPVFTRYECVGLHGIPFRLLRFHCPEDNSVLSSLLRRYRLAALPQLINLIRGEIALIGPRPEKVEFHEELQNLIPFYVQKLTVKPGLFGWSQLHCDPAPYENTRLRLEYDLYYIKHVSMALDFYIMLRGLKRVISGERTQTVVPMSAEKQLS